MSENTIGETTAKTIAELQPYDKRIDVVFKVVSKEEVREVTSRKTNETHKVCDVTVADTTGSIILTLWDADIDAVNEESTYMVKNGYVNIFGTSMRLAKGKYGEIQNTDETIGEVNADNNRSNEEHQRRVRRRRDFGGGGGGRGGGRGSWGGDRGGGGGDRRDRRDRYDRW